MVCHRHPRLRTKLSTGQLSKTRERRGGGQPILTRSRLSDSGEWRKKANSNSLHFFFFPPSLLQLNAWNKLDQYWNVVHHSTTSKMFTLQNFFFYFNSPSKLDFYKVWKVHRTMLLRSDEMVQVMTKYPCSHISQQASLSL